MVPHSPVPYYDPTWTHAAPTYGIDKQDAGGLFLDDGALAVGAVLALGALAVGGAVVAANGRRELNEQIESNDGDIATLTARVARSCSAVSAVAGVTAAAAGADAAALRLVVNNIISAANNNRCT